MAWHRSTVRVGDVFLLFLICCSHLVSCQAKIASGREVRGNKESSERDRQTSLERSRLRSRETELLNDLVDELIASAYEVWPLANNKDGEVEPITAHNKNERKGLAWDPKLRSMLDMDSLSTGEHVQPRLHQAQRLERASIEPGVRTQRNNVKLMYLWVALGAMYWGVSSGAVFDQYLFQLSGGKNSMVGIAESVSGLTSLVSALPIGFLVDRRPDSRASLCKISCYLGLLGTAAMILAVVFDNFPLVFVALVLQGVFYELSSSVTEALFADSIPQGNRADIFTKKAMVQTAFSSVGPGLTALSFYLLGNTWKNPRDVKTILIAGNVFLPLASWSLLFFRDPPAALMEQEEEEGDNNSPSTLATDPRFSDRRALGFLRPRHVPYILALSNLVTCIGAGMTCKFFNLWWINEVGFSGAAISLVQTAYPLVIAVLMHALEIVAKHLGRAQASLLFFSLSGVFFVGLAEFQSIVVLLIFYFLRGGLSNAVYPIDRSILMDFTPSSQRGRWNTVESFAASTWSGSAFLGGLISDKHDYRYTFLITTGIYCIAMALYSPLLMLVPRKEPISSIIESKPVSRRPSGHWDRLPKTSASVDHSAEVAAGAAAAAAEEGRVDQPTGVETFIARANLDA